MTRRVVFVAAAIAVLGCVGFGQEGELSSPTLRIAWGEFKPLYDAKKVVVVDVRDEGSFRAGHIPGARCIPLDNVEKRVPDLKKLQKPIVTYCA